MFFGCQTDGKKFSLHGKSHLVISNNSLQDVLISVSNWSYISSNHQEFDTLLYVNSAISLSLITQAKTYYILKVGAKEYPMFAMPDAQGEIFIDNENQVRFEGELREINEFLQTRSNYFGSVYPDSYPRSAWYQGKGLISELVNAYDSINLIDHNLLEMNDELPIWYKKFEGKRLDYSNAYNKLSGLMYRRKMIGLNDQVPDGYLDSVVGNLPIENEDFIGTNAYMMFLNFYVAYKNDPLLESSMPTTTNEWKETYDGLVNVTKSHLHGTIKDISLTHLFFSVIKHKRALFNLEWIELIDDEELVAALKDQLQSEPLLTRSQNAPYFYLTDSSNVYYDIESFKGNILLVNFWATWCKPCYKLFPLENGLVDRYQSHPVVILNICIDSKTEKWKEVIRKYNLKTTNLLAEGNWNDRLKEAYAIDALPQSVLIDWRGKINQFKSLDASSGVEAAIEELLLEMEK